MTNTGILKVNASKVVEGTFVQEEDHLVVEEPLEIRLQYGPQGHPVQQTVSITMRTPGNDADLSTGFLFTEGVIQHPSQVKMVIPGADGPNTVLVILNDNIQPVISSLQRNFYTSSSCGVCGKASIESIRTVSVFQNIPDEMIVNHSVVYTLPEKVRQQQSIFESTGGLHAAALFDSNGELTGLQEDVGRHNALDKLIGQVFTANRLPLTHNILFLSGRASFELVQKAHMAGIKMIAAVGAPSSIAVELAVYNGITLIGFLRGRKFNLYNGSQRIS